MTFVVALSKIPPAQLRTDLTGKGFPQRAIKNPFRMSGRGFC